MISEKDKKAIENDILNDILYDIDMQLYDEFNDKIATMNDHLGDIYSLRDIEEVENAQKEKEIELLRIAVAKLQKEIEKLKEANEYLQKRLYEKPEDPQYEKRERLKCQKQYNNLRDTIREKIKELEEVKTKELENDDEFGIHSLGWENADYIQDYLKELLEEN